MNTNCYPSYRQIIPDNGKIINNNYFNKEDLEYSLLNENKVVSIYMSFYNSLEWPNKIFNGNIEKFTNKYIILNEKDSGKKLVLPLRFIDYILFDSL